MLYAVMIGIYLIVFLYGIVIGSFLNVLIYRIPKKENIAIVRSHCMSCDHTLAWYDLFPLFSWIFLGGKCRYCKAKISKQYPLIEGLNGLCYVLMVFLYGLTIRSLLYALLCSALIALSVIDFRTYEIPVGFNIFIGLLGLVRLVTDFSNWKDYLFGLFSVSLLLFILFYATKGRGIGGGDVKLMAASGLLLGWQWNLFAFATGCILGSVIHLIRMKVSKEGSVLAMGPYLSAGIFLALTIGTPFINWYLGLYR